VFFSLLRNQTWSYIYRLINFKFMCKNIIIIITSTSVHLNKNVTFRTDRYESDSPVYFPTMAILTWKFDCAIVLDLNGHSLKSIRGNTLPLTLGTIRRIMTSESYRSLQFVKFGGPFCPLRQLRFPRYLSSTAYINRNIKKTVDTSALLLQTARWGKIAVIFQKYILLKL